MYYQLTRACAGVACCTTDIGFCYLLEFITRNHTGRLSTRHVLTLLIRTCVLCPVSCVLCPVSCVLCPVSCVVSQGTGSASALGSEGVIHIAGTYKRGSEDEDAVPMRTLLMAAKWRRKAVAHNTCFVKVRKATPCGEE
jgi:hypothetical protein